MLLILYVFLGWVITPFAYEFLNRKELLGGKVANVLKGWPSYLVNVIICALVALLICFLPGGWTVSFSNWFLLTAVIYFGNQFFFNSLIKPLIREK